MSEHDDIAAFLDVTFKSDDDNVVSMARGIVTQYDPVGMLASVAFAGGTKDVPNLHHFDHYTPVIDDDVHCIRIGPDVMVFGKIAR
jgi:hypothetical protein